MTLYEHVLLPDFSGQVREDIKRFLLCNQKQETFKHVTGVEKACREIAEQYRLEKEICGVAALLHDISAVVPPEDMLLYARQNELLLDGAEEKHPFLLHQRISRVITEELFHIRCGAVLSAVECHTTLKKDPSPYDMALFLADKLCWDQQGVPPFYEVLKESLAVSLEKASLDYIEYVMGHGMILHPHSWLLAARADLKNKVQGKAPAAQG